MHIIVENILRNKKTNKKTNLLSSDNSFAIRVDEYDFLDLYQVFEAVDNSNITACGDGTNVVKNVGHAVSLVNEGDFIIFGKNHLYDAEVASSKRALKIAKDTVYYDLSEELDVILKAIKQFGKAKSKLEDKYPRNLHSRTLYEMMALENNKSTATTSGNKKESCSRKVTTITSNFIVFDDGSVALKNAANPVVYETCGQTIEVSRGFFGKKTYYC